MKLAPTNEKVNIKWFVINDFETRKLEKPIKGVVGYIAWEAKCSCGWETKTGGAIKAEVQRQVFRHKYYHHNYSIVINHKVGA